MSKFIIKDWAGNTCFHGKTFPTFEDAWGFIYDQYRYLSDEEAEEYFGEYYVEPETEQREKRYLDPFDPRAAI